MNPVRDTKIRFMPGPVSNGVKRIFKAGILLFLLCVFFDQRSAWPEAVDKRREASLHYYRGVMNFEAGHYENALEEFQKVASLDPYYKDTQRYVGDSLRKLERDIFKGAQTKSLHGKDTDFYFLGKSYYEKGDYSRALETFKVVLAKNPNDRYALYYAQLCRNAMPKTRMGKRSSFRSPAEEMSANVLDLANEVSYIKEDVKSKEDMELFLEMKVEREADRAELIRKKEQQLKRQEELLKEEKEDYMAQAKITSRAKKVKSEAEKWKNMKEGLASNQPGLPAELSDYPVYLNKAENYYVAMKESLRTSRWNSAGLNAIQASFYYCDAMLIYFYNVKSSYPKHENINRLLLQYVKRVDVEENVFRMRSILNLKKISEEEDKPFSRSQAMFLADETEKMAQWCKSILP